jgi:GDPmannose 4,6-dehydratase
MGMQNKLYLGNLSASRDWGHAKDYVKAMYLILQQDQPDDYVIATGISTSIRDFVKLAAAELGLKIDFSGEGEEEKGSIVEIDEQVFIEKVGEEYLDKLKHKDPCTVEVDPNYFRPTEVDLLIGKAEKARIKLGWEPEYDLKGLISDMITSDIKLVKQDAHLKDGGFETLNYFE